MANAYTYAPPCEAEELHRMYVVEGMTQQEVADALGCSLKRVQTAMRKAGIQPRRAVKRDQRADRNANWKGGKVVWSRQRQPKFTIGQGYTYVLDPDHPHALAQGYVAEHVKVALAEAGRERLAKGECVHHINLDKSDNRTENLAIAPDASTHSGWHYSLAQVGVELLRRGAVAFDPERGYYLT